MAGWSSILEGDDEARAWRVLEELAESLREPRDTGDVSLGHGNAGVALFFGYLARITGRPDLVALAQDRLGVAIDRVIVDPPHPFLWSGITGVAWVAEHLAAMGPEPGGDDPHDEIDRMVLELLDNPLDSVPFELMRGVAGFGVYAVERLPRPTAAATLERVVDALAAMAEGGATWFSSPERMSAAERARHPAGVHSLGVAHGACGPIGVLAAACAWRVAEDRARPLLENALDWLWRQRLADGQLPRSAGEREPSPPSWCRGEAGAAAALLAAASAAGLDSWRQRAVELALRDAERIAAAGDAAICHGAAGLAHLFHRCHAATGEAAFASAARRWYHLALDLHRPGRPGVLDGGAGIGLALLAATTPVEPAWDRPLLLSIRTP